MPLDTNIERVRRVFEAFDDAIRRQGRDPETVADVTDGLMMRGVHVQLRLAEDGGEFRALLEQDVVAMAIARLTGMIDIGAQLRIDVLDERASGGDIHHLDAEADAESGNAALAGDASQRQIVALTARVHRFDARMPLLAVYGGIAIVAAGEKNPVQT